MKNSIEQEVKAVSVELKLVFTIIINFSPSWHKFSQKLHENEKILGCRGARGGTAPLDPPLLNNTSRTFF